MADCLRSKPDVVESAEHGQTSIRVRVARKRFPIAFPEFRRRFEVISTWKQILIEDRRTHLEAANFTLEWVSFSLIDKI